MATQKNLSQTIVGFVLGQHKTVTKLETGEMFH